MIASQRQNDKERVRPPVSADHLREWQDSEKIKLKNLCLRHQILYIVVDAQGPQGSGKVSMLLQDFRNHSEEQNLSKAYLKLEDALGAGEGDVNTVLLLDGDKTLSPGDSGTLFWENYCRRRRMKDLSVPLTDIFSSAFGYSENAFRQVVLLHEELSMDERFDFEGLCTSAASQMRMHPEFVSLLQVVGQHNGIRAVVVTCGVARIWEKVLQREGLSYKVAVVGGGRLADGYVVTPAVKAALVSRLKKNPNIRVWAFGDSPMDLEMLKRADQAIVVVDPTRNTSMNDRLQNAIREGFRGRQILLPRKSTIRFKALLPLSELIGRKLVDEIVSRGVRRQKRIRHATGKNATKLLMTPTRNATIHGPALIKAHRRVGRFLATLSMPDVVGVEGYEISHVQGQKDVGYRIQHEETTTIVALMRGGEPMALGVFDVLPSALFLHANSPQDIASNHLEGQHAIVLVDSVINTGKTVVQFVQRIRELHATLRIVIIAGVVQENNTHSDSLFRRAFDSDLNMDVVALRISQNEFVGSGGSDTGNRLFNTAKLT